MRRIFGAALIAGLIAGLLVSALQELRVVPLILQAEEYEMAAPAVAHGDPSHDHGAAWAPHDGWERRLFTALANIVTAAGFGLLLTAAYALRGRPVGLREGLIWGLAGFCAFALAPAIGLPPEPPGLDSGVVQARQLWWVMTALGTALGLALLAFVRGGLAKAAGIALLVLPHLVGAPHPAPGAPSPVPREIVADFIIASLATAGVFWVALGALTGTFYRRFS